MLLATAVGVALVSTTIAAWSLTRPAAPFDDTVVRTTIEFPYQGRMYVAGQGTKILAIAPQGDRIAYNAQDSTGVRAYTRKLDGLEVQLIGSEVLNDLAFSPNGRWLAFVSGDELRKVQADGGPHVPLARVAYITTRGLAWLGPDTLLIGTSNGLKLVHASGGAIHAVSGSDSTTAGAFPIVLPDGKSVVYSVGLAGARTLAVLAIDDVQPTDLEIPALIPLGYRDNHLIYVSPGGAIMAVPFDVRRRRTTGEAVQLEANVRQTNPGSADAALSETGTLVYLSGNVTSRLMLSDARGVPTPLFSESRNFMYPRFSPDGRKVAVGVQNPPTSDIWVYDRTDRTFQRLTTRGDAGSPEWTPDGKRILFRAANNASGIPNVQWLPADGSGAPETLYEGESINEAIISPDGQWLIYRTSPGGVHSRDIFARRISGDTTSILLAGGPTQQSHPRLSPNGQWLAYQSSESNRFEVYVRPFPGAGPRTQVSSAGGSEPVWSRSGEELYYRSPDGITAARVTAASTFTLHERRTVSGQFAGSESATHQSFDVAPDGAIVMPVLTGGGTSVILVHNWGRVMRERLGREKAP